MDRAAERNGRARVAVIGAGISGLSAAWLLADTCDVTLYESDNRLGGHANTVDVETTDGAIAVDTGFIVFNPNNYPNLTALFDHLGVETAPSHMSFAVSLDEASLEYGGSTLRTLFAQPINFVRPRFWSMLRDIVRFYGQATADLATLDPDMSLGDYLAACGYGAAFRDDHILPMAGAIWSASPDTLRDHPAAAFIQFFKNHGLLELRDRPLWRTVKGGSRTYVTSLARSLDATVLLDTPVTSVARTGAGVIVRDGRGGEGHYDHVVMATHADQTLQILTDPSQEEARLLGTFRYARSIAVLHSDALLMPKRRSVWSSWNYLGERGASDTLCVTYWMNRLQPLGCRQDLFVTLNPAVPPRPETVHRTEGYEHPIFTREALAAQANLGELQGRRNTWFCGAYLGSGFHEDGLKSGLDVAEALGGKARPWSPAGPVVPSTSRLIPEALLAT